MVRYVNDPRFSHPVAIEMRQQLVASRFARTLTRVKNFFALMMIV